MSDEQQKDSRSAIGINTVGDVSNVTGAIIGHDAHAVLIRAEDRHSLREWWHGIMRTHGRYSCYAIFLTLPSDNEVLRYLTEYGGELNVISGKNCLVIALSQADFQRTDFDEGTWRTLVEEHTTEGHSVAVARLFGIDFTKFPCLLVFQDIRSPEHVVIGLNGMRADDIAIRMRLIFAIIDIAIQDKKKPLDELEKQQSIEFLHRTGQSVASKVSEVAEKTFEKAMEAWINVTIR